MKFQRKARHIAESLLICLGFSVLPFLPRSGILKLSHWLGNMAFRVCGKLRKIAMANLDVGFGSTLSRKDKEAIAHDSFRTFSLLLLDLFWFSVFVKKRMATYVHFDPSFDSLFNTKPAVVVTGHLGNWEVLGQAVTLRGNSIVSVVTPLANPFADRMLNRFRRLTGQKVATRKGAVRMLIKVLRSGGRTVLLMDQNTLPEDGGEFVNFFGLPVPVSKAAYALSDRTGADIVFVFCLAEGAQYTAYATSPLKVHKSNGSNKRITQTVAAMMEEAIRKHPGQWLWMYKRWKYIPQEANPEKYHFYARKV